GGATACAWSDARFEQNRFYQSALLDAPDLWLWDLIVSPNTKSYHFPLAGLASSADPGHLRVTLQGASDFDANPDHHVRASINGVPVGEVSWDGKTAIVLEGDLADGVLQEGDNQLDLQNVGDTAASSSMVFLDRFEVRYPRQATAPSGVLDAAFSTSGVATVGGLSAGSAVVDTTTRPRWPRQTAAEAAGVGPPRRGRAPLPRGRPLERAPPRGAPARAEHAPEPPELGGLPAHYAAGVPRGGAAAPRAQAEPGPAHARGLARGGGPGVRPR